MTGMTMTRGGRNYDKEVCIECGRDFWRTEKATWEYCFGCRQVMVDRTTSRDGYVMMKIGPDDMCWGMTSPWGTLGEGWISEHRYVMAQHLGRCLESGEQVHHIDGVRDNNEVGNLQLHTAKTHPRSYKLGYDEGYDAGWADGYIAKEEE